MCVSVAMQTTIEINLDKALSCLCGEVHRHVIFSSLYRNQGKSGCDEVLYVPHMNVRQH